MEFEKADPIELFSRICKLAQFARSVLHYSFIDLEKVNPSFDAIGNICELFINVLEKEAHNSVDHISYVMEQMRDIAVAVKDKDNGTIVDCMATLDEFFELGDVKPHLKKVDE